MPRGAGQPPGEPRGGWERVPARRRGVRERAARSPVASFCLAPARPRAAAGRCAAGLPSVGLALRGDEPLGLGVAVPGGGSKSALSLQATQKPLVGSWKRAAHALVRKREGSCLARGLLRYWGSEPGCI